MIPKTIFFFDLSSIILKAISSECKSILVGLNGINLNVLLWSYFVQIMDRDKLYNKLININFLTCFNYSGSYT